MYAGTGCTALIYEIVWTRLLGLQLGTFTTAVATVVAVYMAGLGMGNFCFARRAEDRSPARALVLYGQLECFLAVYAALSPWILSVTSTAIAPANALWGLRQAVICGMVLLPPTTAMGGTWPVMVQVLGARSAGPLGGIYAANTLGATLGPLLAAYVLMPTFGLTAAIRVAVVANAAMGIAALLIARKAGTGSLEVASSGKPPVPATAPATDSTPLIVACRAFVPALLASVGGFVALALEISYSRLAALTIAGNSTYGLALTLSSFLLGLVLGGVAIRQWPPPTMSAALARFAGAQALVFVASALTPLWSLVPAWLAPFWVEHPSYVSRSAMDFAVVALLLLPVTSALGYSLPSLMGLISRQQTRWSGYHFGANTLGGVGGVLVSWLFLLPFLGLHRTFMLLGILAMLTGCAAMLMGPTRKRALFMAAIPVSFLPFWIVPEPDRFQMNLGIYNRPQLLAAGTASLVAKRAEVLFQQDSYTGRIAVLSAGPSMLSFHVNGKPDGSTGLSDMSTQVGSPHLAALCHPNPRRVLVIGLGTGVSVGSLALHPQVESINVVEIEPAVVAAERFFSDYNHGGISNPRVHVMLADARHLLQASRETYDVVFSEPSNLFVSGMVNLYTAEFYRAVRARLNPGGVFLQWVHYYQMTPGDVKGAIHTFLTVFPQAVYWINEYGDSFLMGRDGGGVELDLDGWKRRLRNTAVAADLRRIEVSPPLTLVGFYLWGPGDLARLTTGARLCTDDFPYLEFSSARVHWGGSRAGIEAYARMVLLGPVDPIPLVRENASSRLELANIFRERHCLARAESEYGRALELDHGLKAAAKRLHEVRVERAQLERVFIGRR